MTAPRRAGLAVVAFALALAACGGSSLTLVEARKATLCALDAEGWRVDILPGPGAHISARVVAEDPDAARARLRELLDPDTPTGLAQILVQGPRPLIAVVIDDLGLHPDQIAALWDLGNPVTWALLPLAPHTPAYAAWLEQSGASMLVHVPMEPMEAKHMTLPGYLRADMTRAERRAVLDQALAAVPGAVGLSNHMGSRLTSDRAVMAEVVGALPEGYVVIDSRTASDSQLGEEARRQGHPTASRAVFLDNERDVELIREQLDVALERANNAGHAVAIGHPYPETAAALAQFVSKQGGQFHFVPVEYVTTPPTRPIWLRGCPEPEE